MTNERINIKIAGLCGHPFETKEVCRRCRGVTPYEAGDDYGITIWEECRHCNNTGKVAPYHVGLLNYAADLNVIVGVCREQSDEIKALIAAALTVIVMGWSGGQPDLSEREDVENYRDFFDIMAANPRQWCEAFLRVHSQWEEQP